jgi:hypothetical protein
MYTAGIPFSGEFSTPAGKENHTLSVWPALHTSSRRRVAIMDTARLNHVRILINVQRAEPHLTERISTAA